MRLAFALAVLGLALVLDALLVITTTGRPGSRLSAQAEPYVGGVALLVLSAARALGVALGAFAERRPCAGALTFALVVGGTASWLIALVVDGFAPAGIVVAVAVAMLGLAPVVAVAGAVGWVRRRSAATPRIRAIEH